MNVLYTSYQQRQMVVVKKHRREAERGVEIERDIQTGRGVGEMMKSRSECRNKET